ncbi:MauE/DoxX family redox-associated membrane protein [Streptomyces sparsogenes]|uniref:MauE/DoxX family redox-associated membrane protein n=1 Tax=Streptomyces sparsogenes TaxID=67365 RepID=UPI00384D548A
MTGPAAGAAELAGVAPPLTAGLLGWTGAAKLLPRRATRPAPPPALARLVRGAGRAAVALRLLGACELLLAAGLLALPRAAAPGVAAAVLGVAFTGYLVYARRVAPGSSCGCTGGGAGPVTWRAFARAAALAAGGAAAALAATAGEPWWAAVARRPAAAPGVAGAAVAGLVALYADADAVRWWLVRRRGLRRGGLRRRGAGPPPAGPRDAAGVPVAATVQLLERSLAWRAAAPVVRSALLDHWDDGGWRVLQFSGVHDGGGAGARPVFVLFALDATADVDTVAEPAVRVGIVDADTGVPLPLPTAPGPTPPLPPPGGTPAPGGTSPPGGAPAPGGTSAPGRSSGPGPAVSPRSTRRAARCRRPRAPARRAAPGSGR